MTDPDEEEFNKSEAERKELMKMNAELFRELERREAEKSFLEKYGGMILTGLFLLFLLWWYVSFNPYSWIAG